MKNGARCVVVGFDGSPEARDALVLAKEFARIGDGSLHVAFVQWDENPRARQQRFERLFSEARRELGSQPFTEEPVEATAAGHALEELAERLPAGLIAVGSCHRGAIGRVLLGSVGEELLSGAPCSVLVAPRGYADREHFGIGLIGVAYDGTPEARVALDAAADLARELGCTLRLVGVVPEVGPGGRISGTGPGFEKLLADDLAVELEAARRSLDPALEASTVLEHGDPADALAVEGVELDLLVVGSRGYGPVRRALLGGTSAKLMRLAPCPVLVTPRGAEAGLELTATMTSEGAAR